MQLVYFLDVALRLVFEFEQLLLDFLFILAELAFERLAVRGQLFQLGAVADNQSVLDVNFLLELFLFTPLLLLE